MKKGIIIGLIVLVGGAFVFSRFFGEKNNGGHVVEKNHPAVFEFEQNLATIGNEVVEIKITVTEALKSLEVKYNDSVLKTWLDIKDDVSFSFDAGMFGVGARGLAALSTLEDGSEFIDSRIVRVLSEIDPVKMYPKILNSYPHRQASFTQGLEFYEGTLYEGTGDPDHNGATLIAEVELETGKHLKTMGLGAGYFGEGITIINGIIYQLTYKKGKCYTYSINKDLQLRDEFNYLGEGWGLCNDGSNLIMSNGTERISFRDTATFVTTKVLEVYNNNGPITGLNELEYIDGKIYANIWTSNIVVAIDPQTGKVLEEVDATELVREGKGLGEVLNGIAYNPLTKKIYMTGKYWDRLYEVRFEPFVDPIQ